MKNPILLLLLLVVFASCSQQRYSSREKVRVKQAQVQAHVEKKESPQAVIVAPQVTEGAQVQAESPVLPEALVVVPPVTPKAEKNAVREFFKDIRTKSEQTAFEKLMPKAFKKKLEKENHQELPKNEMWFRLIVIGLILALISWFLPNPVSWLVGTVGSILILIGLIILLLKLL